MAGAKDSVVTIPAAVADTLVKFSQAVWDSGAEATTTIDSGTSGGSIYAIEIDNSSNSVDVYLKGWFISGGGAVTIGSTGPDLVLKCASGTKTQYTFSSGMKYTLQLRVAVLTAGGTGGTTAPDSTVYANFLFTAD